MKIEELNSLIFALLSVGHELEFLLKKFIDKFIFDAICDWIFIACIMFLVFMEIIESKSRG